MRLLGTTKKQIFINKRQKYFQERYGSFIPHVTSDVGVYHIVPAYEMLRDLLDGNPPPKQIQRTAEECLYEHLLFDEENEEQVEAFSGFEPWVEVDADG